MKISPVSYRIGAAGALLLVALLSYSCDSGGPSIPDVDGRWVGSVPEVELELTLTLLGQLQNRIIGAAQLESPTMGRVQGDISGVQNGQEISLTIEVADDRVGGSVVFDGAFEGNNNLSGTLDSGLIQGVWPVTLSREKN